MQDGRIVAVLDFGLLGVGDPAADLFVGWSLLDAPSSAVFQEAARADSAMWLRGRGWAVFNAVIALAFYGDSNPVLSDRRLPGRLRRPADRKGGVVGGIPKAPAEGNGLRAPTIASVQPSVWLWRLAVNRRLSSVSPAFASTRCWTSPGHAHACSSCRLKSPAQAGRNSSFH